MTTSSSATAAPRMPLPRVTRGLLVAALLAVTVWAATVEQDESAESAYRSPSAVEAGEHGEPAWVRLTSPAVRRIGLEVTRVAGAAGVLEVPYAAVIYAADGTTWVYVADPTNPLRFRREEVLVGAVLADRVTLVEGPAPGSHVVGTGAVQLYGAEFEVGH